MFNRDGASQNEGARQTQTPAPAVSSRQPGERPPVTWVGKSVVFRGDLMSQEDMTIDGRVEGTIEIGDNHLTVGPDARIQADIVAKAVTILGTVTGTIIARERLEVHPGGSIDGDITSPRLAVADGAVLHGRVDTGNRAAARKEAMPQVTATV
jgi:cytoskeletal protein CcmA (bactofilin family)